MTSEELNPYPTMSHNHPSYNRRLHAIARRWWARKARTLRNAGNLPASQGALDLALAHNRLAHLSA